MAEKKTELAARAAAHALQQPEVGVAQAHAWDPIVFCVCGGFVWFGLIWFGLVWF